MQDWKAAYIHETVKEEHHHSGIGIPLGASQKVKVIVLDIHEGHTIVEHDLALTLMSVDSIALTI